MTDETWLDEAAAQFRVTDDALRQGMLRFEEEMALGLRQPAASSLYMEPCYAELPTGRERGRAVTLDFGGTNARAALVELAADGCHVRGEVRRPLRAPGAYDVTRAETAEALFDFLADLVREALARGGAQPGEPLPLGHTFSFGTRQRRLGDARLIAWSKEIAVPGVEGAYVNEQLRAALVRAGLANVMPTAILNDTAAVLLAAAFRAPGTAIAAIYATGFNSCYLETFGGRRPPMVYNIESGSFRHFPQNPYDRQLDTASAKPGAQRLEKMISGRYLGELLTRVLREGLHDAALPPLTAEMVGEAAQGTLAALPGGRPLPSAASLATLARALIRRSARLAAMTLAAVLRHRAAADRQPRIAPQTLAVDGAVFAHMPGVAATMQETLALLLGEETAQGISLHLVRDASGRGAAIAGILGAGERDE